MISYFYVDESLALFIKKQSILTVHSIAKLITQFGEAGLYLVLFGFLFLFNRYKLKNKKNADKGLYLLSCVIASGLACDLIKGLLGRARPIELFAHDVYGFHFFQTHYAWVSFPSGHATTAGAVAMGLALLKPRYWKECFIAAALVALSRVTLDVHYLSDVMAGLYLGALTSLCVARFFKKKIDFSGQITSFPALANVYAPKSMNRLNPASIQWLRC